MKTIATISTPTGSGAIGIIRLSGDNAKKIATKMFSCKKLKSFEDAIPNYMYYGTLHTRNFDDKIFAVYFQAPHTYTGEDMVELQCHGGVRLVQETLKECLFQGAEIADKGEFTRRAFLNGKMSLSDCEGVIDMINGESLSALNASSRLMQGGIASQIKDIQANLLDAIADLEASLDYPEEMEEESKSNCHITLEKTQKLLSQLSNTSQIGGYVKNGIAVALVGQANVGKSSLLNRLLGKERAIVTDIAGTTRDSLEECLEVQGYMLKIVDTAGIRQTDDKVESIGVAKSLEIAHNSDIVLFLSVANKPYNAEEVELLEKLKANNCVVLEVYNKSDLGVDISKNNGIAISAMNNVAIDELKDRIIALLIDSNIDVSGNIITNQRHNNAIVEALANLKSAYESLDYAPTECVLVDLRTAYFSLGKITGDTASEDIIDSIFSKFCLGK